MMKKLLISTFLGMLALGAAAQTEPDPSVRITGYQIVLPEHRYQMSAQDLDVYKGMYDLSNGQTMRLRVYGNRMYAAVNDGQRKMLVASSPNTFVATDMSLKMTLNRSDFDEVTGEMLMVVPHLTAQGETSGTEVVRLLTSR
ncbi:hypothetical protein Q4S45_18305 [Massilia sp. R2A-15]|uniref:hypothetical protein n=1 Tax=Massilia sp. R2A-15 TaxID=3064278 RepID=UPI0027329BF8|nr:hypothetical protein [Massilia sp. R2A-15]WLI88651.1 hypothetical protein Q4S45_18305 [Massilia sp. R2A-15]